MGETYLLCMHNLVRFRWYPTLNQHSRQYCTTGPNAFTPRTQGSFVIQIQLLEMCLSSHIPASVMTGVITTEPVLRKPQRFRSRAGFHIQFQHSFKKKKGCKIKKTAVSVPVVCRSLGSSPGCEWTPFSSSSSHLLPLAFFISLLLNYQSFISLSLSPNPLHRLHLPSCWTVHVDDVRGIAIACH